MGKRGPKPRFLDVACPNEQCNLFGIAGKGNVTVYGTYKISSGKVRKYVCHTCGTRFCDRTNTAFYDTRTNEEKIKLALKMAMLGMSVLGIAEIFKSKPSTVSTWISKAAKHSEKVAPRYLAWINLNWNFSVSFVPSVVNRDALTQPQRHRGTEAIFSARPHPHNSAKSRKSQ